MPAKKKPELTGLSRPWKHGEWFTVPGHALATWCAAACLSELGISAAEQGAIVPVGFGLGTAVITAATIAGVQAHDAAGDTEMHRHAKIFVVSGVFAAAGWLTWSTAMSPFNAPGVLVLGAASLISTIFYRAVRFKQHAKGEAELARKLAKAEAKGGAKKWAARFELMRWGGVKLAKAGEEERYRKCLSCYGGQVTDPDTGMTSTCMLCGGEGVRRTGYRLHLLLPADGSVPRSTIASAAALERFEQVAGVQRAGSASIVYTDHPRHIAIDVDEADVLAEVVTLPPDNPAELTINKPFRIGLYSDGSPIEIQLGRIHVGIYGATGSGKSETIHAMIKRLAYMQDVVIMAIDGKGGATMRAWLTAWLDDHVNNNANIRQPIINYLAVTPTQAHLLLTGLRAAIDYRVSQHPGGRSKTMPTKDMPAIVVFGEEIAEVATRAARRSSVSNAGSSTVRVATPSQVNDELNGMLRLGRSEAITFLPVAQRATVGVVDGDQQSQIGAVIAHGRCRDSSEAQRMMRGAPPQLARELAAMKHPGSVAIRTAPGEPWRKGRVEFNDDEAEDVIPELARERSPYRPVLDYGTAKAMHDAIMAETKGKCGYFDSTEDGGSPGVAGRWEQLRDQPGFGPTPGGADDTPVSPAGPTSADTTTTTLPARPAPRPTIGELPAPAVDAVFNDLVNNFQVLDSDPVPQPGPTGDSDATARAWIIDYVCGSGRRGCLVNEIVVGYRKSHADAPPKEQEVSRGYVQRVLKDAAEQGLIFKRDRDFHWYPPEMGQQDVA